MATFLKFFLPVFIAAGYFYVNKWHKFEEPMLRIFDNVLLALLAIGWISLLIAG
jgi:hypothetical protein